MQHKSFTYCVHTWFTALHMLRCIASKGGIDHLSRALSRIKVFLVTLYGTFTAAGNIEFAIAEFDDSGTHPRTDNDAPVVLRS